MKVISVTPQGKKKLVEIAEIQPNVVIENVACDPTVFIGAAVIMRGGIAYNAKADSVNNSNVIGIVESKPTETTCNIRVSGVTGDIFTDLQEEYEYYLSATDEGKITTTIPTASGSVIIKLGQPFSSSRLFVNRGERILRS